MEKGLILLEFAKIELEYAKHHENQRERMTALLMVIAGVSIAAVGWGGGISPSDAWIGIFLLAVGILGTVFSLKHYAHFKLHYARYREYRKELDDTYGDSQIMALKDQGDSEHDKKLRYPFTKAIPLHILWALLPSLTAIFGFLIFVFSIAQMGCPASNSQSAAAC